MGAHVLTLTEWRSILLKEGERSRILESREELPSKSERYRLSDARHYVVIEKTA